jgi:hypothetical protein
VRTRADTLLVKLHLALLLLPLSACNCDEELYAFPGDLTGVLCASNGALLAEAPITITDANGASVEAATDASGRFTVEGLGAGTATIAFDGTRTAEVFIEGNEVALYEDASCRASLGDIDGCACDESAAAWVSGADVYVITNAGSVYSAQTDDAGCFALSSVPIGPQIVTIQKGTFFEEHQVDVAAGASVSVPTPATCAPVDGAGTVEGRVCASDGATWLANATVFVEDGAGARISSDQTDAEGRYLLLNVPAGQQLVHIQAGSFHSTVTVTVDEGRTTVVPADQCALDAPDVQVAVVSGDYDRVEEVLARIGVDDANIDMYDGGGFFDTSPQYVSELLENYQALAQYDIVFLNCGLNDFDFLSPSGANDVAVDNLRQFVSEGGSIYASDWAYSLVERAWAARVDFVGNDDGADEAKVGDFATAINGTIVDASLATAMGDADIELHYPLPSWVPMQAVAADVTVYIQGEAPLDDGSTLSNVPHTVGFNAGAGRVIYTSFHQEPGISLAQERVLELLMFEL